MSALLCFAGVLTSCENTVELVAPEMGDETHETLTRTPEEAIEIAAQAAIEYSVTESRAMPRLVKQRSLRILGSNPSRSEEDDTLIYVVEYENNEGFALISAKKTTEPILAVVNDGNFQEAMDSEFPVVPDFIQKSKRYI